MNVNSKSMNIRGYRPFYIQGATDAAAIDTKTAYGMIAKTNPYSAIPSAKEPYRNEWFDQNGSDEYTAEMYYESLEIDVEFYAKEVDDFTRVVDDTSAASDIFVVRDSVATGKKFTFLGVEYEVIDCEPLVVTGETYYNITINNPLEDDMPAGTRLVFAEAAPLLRANMESFFNKVKSGEFKIYDSYTALGFQGVRFAEFSEDSFKARDGWASTVFSVGFKVNDPTTHLSLTNGSIQ